MLLEDLASVEIYRKKKKAEKVLEGLKMGVINSGQGLNQESTL